MGYFETFGDFLAMGGHGFYVWLCYGIVLGGLGLQFIYNRNAEARAQNSLKQYYRRLRRQALSQEQVKEHNEQSSSSLDYQQEVK